MSLRYDVISGKLPAGVAIMISEASNAPLREASIILNDPRASNADKIAAVIDCAANIWQDPNALARLHDYATGYGRLKEADIKQAITAGTARHINGNGAALPPLVNGHINGVVDGPNGLTENPAPPIQPALNYKPLRSLLVDMSTWDQQEPPAQDWGVYNRFPARQAALLSGEGAIGKSSTLLHLCAAFTLPHTDWLGAVLDNGPALFVDCEDEECVIWRRLAPIARYYGKHFTDFIAGGLHLISLVGQDPVLAYASRSGRIETTKRFAELREMAGDIKPKCISIASSANVYAGSEIDRAQVQQFAGHITGLAQLTGGISLLAQHPSLTGITSETGLSGTTQWHNAFRARAYMRAAKQEPGEQPDNDLREISFKKNQYGKIDDTIVLKWQNGMFRPLPGVPSLDKISAEMKADEVFLDLLRRFEKEGRNVRDQKGTNYAPSMFAKEDEAKKAGLNSKHFEPAMRRLFKAEKIRNESCGKPSRPSFKLVPK